MQNQETLKAMKWFKSHRSSTKPALSRKGQAAVEFALIFPLLFFLLYSVVVYAYVFVLQESITFTAQLAASSAISVSPQLSAAVAQTAMIARTRATAVQSLSWLPASQQTHVLGDATGSNVQVSFCPMGATVGNVICPTDTDAIIVTLIFDLNSPSPLFPVISFGGLMGINSVPPLPAQLTSKAVVRI